MFCELCKQKKLRREFPTKTLIDECNHAALHCLRCVTRVVKEENKCSQCLQHVAIDNPNYCEFVKTLQRLFPEAPRCLTGKEEVIQEDIDQTISVVMLGGDSTVLEYNPNMTIQELKIYIQEKLGPIPDKQRLIYKGKEIRMNKNTILATLQDYNIRPFSTLHLIVVLFDIPESFDQVIFDLFWGYPRNKRDYLDASVLIYSGKKLAYIADYRHKVFFNDAVCHSGDVIDDEKREGHHTIDVKLKSLPVEVDKLFFTLSAWNSPNISKYKDPRLRFFDAREPDVQLCRDQLQDAAQSQAVIMSSLSRIDGGWKVCRSLTLSAGNAKGYAPLQKTIGSRIAEGLY